MKKTKIIIILLGIAFLFGIWLGQNERQFPFNQHAEGYYWISKDGCWAYAPLSVMALEEAKKDCIN